MVAANFRPRGLLRAAFIAAVVTWQPTCVFAQLPPPPDQEITVQQLFQEGQAFYKSGRFALAYKRYAAVLALDPGNALALDGEKRTVAAQLDADEQMRAQDDRRQAQQARRQALEERRQAAEEQLSGDWCHPVATWYGYENGEFASRRYGRDQPDPRRRIRIVRMTDSPLRKTWLYRAAEMGARVPSVP